MSNKIIAASFLFISSFVHGQIFFQKQFGDSTLYGYDAQSVQLLTGGSFVVCGVRGENQFSTNPCIVKFDSVGNELWNKVYDNTLNYFNADYIEQTNDGVYILTGQGNASDEMFLLKTDSDGNAEWSKNYFGPTHKASGQQVIQTSDGGYVVVGDVPDSGLYTGDVLIKTDPAGNILWSRSFGQVTSWCVLETADGGFAVSGYTYSNPFTKFIIKTNANGNITWYKIYDTPSNTGSAFSFCQTTDGGFIIASKTDGYGAGGTDVCVFKTDSLGAVQWSKAYGGPLDDHATSIQQTFDGGYIVAGTTFSFGSNFSYDLYVLKLGSAGNVIWSKTYGKGGYQEGGPYAIINVKQSPDSGFIIVSTVGTIGGFDSKIYIVKTDANGFSGCNEGNPLTAVTPLMVQAIDTFISVNPPPISATASVISVTSTGYVTTICESIGIEELAINAISLFPNPFHETATMYSRPLAFGSMNNNTQMKIYNVLGVLVREEKINNPDSYVLHRGSLPDGLYFYQLRTNNSELIGAGKFVIE
ncbi:MAG: T9SS type A sorting domain-containing protein [Bacteroidota bacterium]